MASFEVTTEGPRRKKNPTAIKENAKLIEAAPAAIRSHLPLLPRRAASKANAPMLAAITVSNKDTGRKLNGPLTSGETAMARRCCPYGSSIPKARLLAICGVSKLTA
jgi:hypothetical protein